MTTLEATKSLFAIETANKISTQEENHPILRRVSALTNGANATNEMATYAIRTGDVTTEENPPKRRKALDGGVETAKKTLNVTTQRASDPRIQLRDVLKLKWRICGTQG
jgi:hypothetical protein